MSNQNVSIPFQTGPFLINEDEALKQKLQGIQLINFADGSAKSVAAYFRMPDTEIRDRTYPHIAIDLIQVAYDPSRAHRAVGYEPQWNLQYATPQPGFTLVANDMPLPWTLTYQLAAYSMLPRDDRQLEAAMHQLFPAQFGFLDMTSIDGTIRRADFVDCVRRDTISAQKKRIYCNVFTVNISAEFYVDQVQQIQQVATVAVDWSGYTVSAQ